MKNGCCLDHSCTPASCMALPADMTCSDCLHYARCRSLFAKFDRSTSCDFFPRRFVARGYLIDGSPAKVCHAQDLDDALNGRR